MSSDRALACVLTVFILSLCSFTAISSGALTSQREGGEVKPNWAVNDQWIYRSDMIDFQTYSMMKYSYLTNTSHIITVELRLTPSSGADQIEYILRGINAAAAEYKLSKNGNGWENGSWAMVVVNNGGDPNYSNGQMIDKGTYKMTETCQGELYLDMHNINFKRGDWTEQITWTFGGDIGFTYSITNTTTVSTSNGINAVFKPDWDTKPMNVGDSWKQTDKLTEVTSVDYAWGGDFSGSGTATVTKDYTYDYEWLVDSKAQKQTANTWKGTNTYQDGYKLTRTGSFAWTITEGSNTTSGTTTPGPYDLWYASDGDNFDACTAIDFNGSMRLIYSTCLAFIDTAPKFDTLPTPEVTINSDEAWDFKEGIDFAVSDPDSGNAGQLTYTLMKCLPGHTKVLENLTIDPDTGEIQFTPTQKDVADGYKITLNVSDNYDKGKLSTEATITLNIKNKNHAPMIKSDVMQNFSFQEGDSYTPTWKLSDAIHDADMDANPLMGNASYDPNENLTYSMNNNGSIRVVCPNGIDLTFAHQCSDVRFIALDGKFPRDQLVTMTLTVKDRSGLKVSDQVSMTVQHVNHPPKAIKGPATYNMVEDTQGMIDLKTLFKDIDVWDPNYVTADRLTFDKDAGQHLTITITGTKATIKPDGNWCGEEKTIFTATDIAGASAQTLLVIIVDGCYDGPTAVSVYPTADPTIYETLDGKASDKHGLQRFSVMATENSNKTLTFHWTVEDSATGEVYTVYSHNADWTFTAAFDCDFENEKFCGGDSTKTYYVTASVSDGTFSIEAKKWYITVKNVPRMPVLSGIEVSTVTSTGIRIPLVEKTPQNYTLPYGKVIELDVSNTTTDPDSVKNDGKVLDKLKFEWTSDLSGNLGSFPNILVGAGIIRAPATRALKIGTHVITVKVTNQNNLIATYSIIIKIAGKPCEQPTPGFDGFVVLPAILFIAVIMTYRNRK